MTEQSAGVSATVKWFNPTKGFGFVTALDTPRDALLHASVLAKQGKRWLPEGTEVEVIIDEGPKGLVVSELLEFQEPEEAKAADDGSEWIEAEVKFFNFSKGYGFAMLADAEGEAEDVFFDSRALAQADLDPPRPGERFMVQLVERPQGQAAKRIKVA
jgi:CspA family cold shock protein